MAKLTATRSVLYQNRLYEAGEVLPGYDPALVQAWLEAGSAVLQSDDIDTTPGEPESGTDNGTEGGTGGSEGAGDKEPAPKSKTPTEGKSAAEKAATDNGNTDTTPGEPESGTGKPKAKTTKKRNSPKK